MATPANREVLAAAGLLPTRPTAAGPNDLVVAVAAATTPPPPPPLDDARARLSGAPARRRRREIAPRRAPAPSPRPSPSSTEPTSALISTPGAYATAEALKALKRGLHVFLFSDNVPVEDEIELKALARERACW